MKQNILSLCTMLQSRAQRTNLFVLCRDAATSFMALVALSALCGCSQQQLEPSGVMQHCAVALSGTYDEIHISNGIQVVVSDTVQQPYYVTDSTFAPYVVVRVNSGELEVRHSRDLGEVRNITTTVFLPGDVFDLVDEITVCEASSLLSDARYEGKELDLNIREHSSVQFLFGMTQGELSAELCGGSLLNASGIVTEAYCDLCHGSTLSSEFDGKRYGLEFVKAKIYLDDQSHLQVHSNGVLKGGLKGESVLTYSGKPELKITTQAGSQLSSNH